MIYVWFSNRDSRGFLGHGTSQATYCKQPRLRIYVDDQATLKIFSSLVVGECKRLLSDLMTDYQIRLWLLSGNYDVTDKEVGDQLARFESVLEVTPRERLIKTPTVYGGKLQCNHELSMVT